MTGLLLDTSLSPDQHVAETVVAAHELQNYQRHSRLFENQPARYARAHRADLRATEDASNWSRRAYSQG